MPEISAAVACLSILVVVSAVIVVFLIQERIKNKTQLSRLRAMLINFLAVRNGSAPDIKEILTLYGQTGIPDLAPDRDDNSLVGSADQRPGSYGQHGACPEDNDYVEVDMGERLRPCSAGRATSTSTAKKKRHVKSDTLPAAKMAVVPYNRGCYSLVRLCRLPKNVPASSDVGQGDDKDEPSDDKRNSPPVYSQVNKISKK